MLWDNRIIIDQYIIFLMEGITKSMIDFTTKEIDKGLKVLKEGLKGKGIDTTDIDELLKKKEDNYLNKYQMLMIAYANHAVNSLLLYNDMYKFKGYCYLAARAGERLSDLYAKGLRASGWCCSFNEALRNRGDISYYVKYAILANNWDLAVHIATEDSLFGAVLTQKYEKAKEYLPNDIKKLKKEDDKQLLWSIVYLDEKKLNSCLEKRIKELRYYAKTRVSDMEYLDELGLAMLKLAKRRGMDCKVNVIELPVHLLDDIPVNEDEWKLPEDKELEKILAGDV